jgi:hypothetical protein
MAEVRDANLIELGLAGLDKKSHLNPKAEIWFNR